LAHDILEVKAMALQSKGKDIFIAGGGPVGLTAAIEFKRRGFNLRIIDPDPIVSPESRALAVNPRTLDLMEPSGVTDMMLAAGNRAKRVVIRRNTKVLTEIDLTKIPHRFNFLLVLAQSRTEEILTEKLAAMGVPLERNLTLDTFTVNEKINCHLSNNENLRADILIGADGSHSTVRKTLGLDFSGETDEQEFGLADVELNSWPFPTDTVVLTIMDTHLAPYLPMAEGYGRFISTCGDCLNHLPPDANIKKVVWETDFKLSYRQVQSYQSGNAFLVGDAAHIHSPVGGRGMNLGMEDACWLAWLIEQGREREFSALRHPVGADVLKFTHAFTSFAKSRGILQDAVFQFGLPILTKLPALQRRAFNMLTALNTPAPPWL
jgi:2-polyprenyl-6-methoxyphenol hydroxylase-like FAD-dependent oxidoreductase